MSGDSESKRPDRRNARSASDGVTPPPLSKGLYLVATPIGHAQDITLRALDVLARADVLACEDTRRTRTLLDLHGIAVAGRPMVSYHDRNGAARRPQLMDWLAQGRSIAYASDAGTPLVADPGYRLVEAAQDAGHPVTTIPGPSAVLAALSLAGLPTDRFLFAGFLPPKHAARCRALAELSSVPATLVFFESPRRTAATLADMSQVLGPTRDAAMVRELTKTHEEVCRAPLGTLAADIASRDSLRGEVVLLTGPPVGDDNPEAIAQKLDDALTDALRLSSVSEASREVADRLGLKKRDVYARALVLTKADG